MRVLQHHADPIDPTLADWLRDEIDALLGLEPGIMVLLLGALVVAFPLGLAVLVLVQRHRAARALRTR